MAAKNPPISVVIVSVKTHELARHIDLKNVQEYGFSALGNFVTTFERMSKSRGSSEICLMFLLTPFILK